MRMSKYTGTKQQTEIIYLLIGDRRDEKAPFFPPLEFVNESIKVVRSCPFDLIQLNSEFNYTETKKVHHLKNPKDFRFIYTDDFEAYLMENENQNRIHLLILDDNSKKINQTIELINKRKNELWFTCFAAGTNSEVNDVINYVSDSHNFIESIVDKYDKFKEANTQIDFDITKPEIQDDYLPIKSNFSIALLNTAVIHDIFSTYSVKRKGDRAQSIKDAGEASSFAHNNKNSFSRQDEVIEFIKIVDNYSIGLLSTNTLPKLNEVDPKLEPLILIAPFNNSDVVKIFRNHSSENSNPLTNSISSIISSEQTSNYIFDVFARRGMEDLQLAKAIQGRKLTYLDDIGYLHSSFTNSPVLRLPLKGRSINRELSFFKTDFHSALGKPKNRENISKTMRKLGKSLKDKLLSNKTADYIKSRDGQIVVISDLPVEWNY